jgi:long-chain acyl-CoA synthetase
MQFTLVRDELPKTRLGKIRRFQLPSLIAKPPVLNAGVVGPETQVYSNIRKFLSDQTEKTVFGVKVHDEELLRYPTVGAIVEYVERMKVKMEDESDDWKAILHANADVELPRSSLLCLSFSRAVSFILNRSFRFIASGLEHVPKHPFMLVANLQSYLDGLAIASFLDAWTIQRLYFYAGERHFRRAWLQACAARPISSWSISTAD